MTRRIGLKAAIGAVAGAVALSTLVPATAGTDSCWSHNGSVMRLKADGNKRAFYYEVPKSSIQKSGVTRGTLLFSGRKKGNSYSGTARVFSRYCPDAPLQYKVSGPVSSDQTKVTLVGEREVHDKCQPTGRYTTDTLVFTYQRRC